MSRIESRRLAIYYGYPSGVNGTFNVPGAINVFNDYHLVVFGAGLEEVTHPDHTNTVNIIAGMPNTKVFGYIDATLTLVDIKDKIDKWDAMAVAGIFCDRFGYDFGVLRAAQNDIVDYIHTKNLSAFVNAWNPDDAFAPSGNLVTHLGAKDWFLAESYQIINDDYQPTQDWIDRSEKLAKYSAATETKVAGITTSLGGVYDQAKFDYAYFSSLLYGLDAFGYGEENFAATSGQLPVRPRKRYYGTNYTSGIEGDDVVLTRSTNVGFKINTITKTVDYLI